MKLNTKNLFASLSSSKKLKYVQKKINKFSPSSIKKEKGPNKKDPKSSKVNPFIKNFVRKISRHKTCIQKKFQSSKIEKFHFNDILLTSESDSNHNNENNIETLCKMFQSSKLKSAIILDSNGNSNLNNEDKKFIEDYLNKKGTLNNNINECKINSIKVQNYNHNNILLKQKDSNNKDINNKGKISDEPLDKENNSIFENCTNKSFDSSFLGSSLGEDFLITFNETK